MVTSQLLPVTISVNKLRKMKNIIQVVNSEKKMTTKKNRIAGTLSLLLISSAILVSCSKSGSSGNNNPPVATNTVSIANMAFAPGIITVSAGTTVTWTNNDNMAHTVTADDNSFDSGSIALGGTFSKMFSTAGTYPYHCTIHSTMKGTIVVK
jgi:plastocyanin